MGKTIAFANQKGGVGKTTTSFNFAAELARLGNRVLLVDMDSQANLTRYAGVPDPDSLPYTVGDAILEMIEEDDIDLSKVKVFKNPYFENMRILAANSNLYNVKEALNAATSRENILKWVLEPFESKFDYIVIDCAPSLDIDLLNALVASDEVIIVTTPSAFSYSGTEQLMKTVNKIRRRLNPELKIAGIICNMVDKRNSFNPAMIAQMKASWSKIARVFDTEIPKSIRVDESQVEMIPLSIYEKNNKVTLACEALVKEYLSLED